MGKSNFENEQLLERLSEDKIPEPTDPQEDNDNSSTDENCDNSSQSNVIHSSFAAGHLDNSGCSAVQVNDPAELFVVRIEPGVSQAAAALPVETTVDNMFAQPAAINSFAFAPFNKTAESPMEESSSDSADPPAFASLATAAVASWPVELGAEVVCCQGDSSPVKKVETRDSRVKQSFVTPNISTYPPPIQRLPSFSRHISYEEVVHTEMEPTEDEKAAQRVKSNSFENMSFEQCLLCLTQWVLTLQDVFEDRSRMGLLTLNKTNRSANCSCRKSLGIVQQLVKLDKCFALAFSDENQHTVHMQNLRATLSEFQETLRMNVSIQISNPCRETVLKSMNIVGKVVDFKAFVREALTTILKFVNVLLLIAFCPDHNSKGSGIMEQDEEEDIRSRVASLMSEDKTSSSRDSDVTMNGDDSSSSAQNPDKQQSGGRKRKQIFPKVICPVSPTTGSTPSFFAAQSAMIRSMRRTPPTSPTSSSSPSKRPRRLSRPTVTTTGTSMSSSPVLMTSASWSSSVSPSSTTPALELLETKKKGQRSGLYQWVLWREALKGEKDRRASSSPHSAPPTTAAPTTFQPIQRRHSEMTSWRKLSFS